MSTMYIHNKSANLETCADHLDQYYMMACQQCQLPICVQCMESLEHKDHDFIDLGVAMRENMTELYEKLHQGLLVKHNLWTIKEKLGSEVDEIQLRMIAKYQALQCLLDEVLKENLEDIKRYRETQTYSIEKKLKDTDQFISDLMKNLKEISENLPAQAMIQLKSCSLRSNLFKSSKIIYPEFIENEPDLTNVSDLFGKLKIPQMTVWESSIELDNKDQPDDGDFDVEDINKPTLTLEGSFNLTSTASHISQFSSNLAWVSDFNGDLYLLDDNGFKLHHLKTLSGGSGCHTVTNDGELIFINPEKVIMKISKDLQKDDLDIYIPPSLSPCCIYSSQLNSDLLIGLLDKNITNQGALLRIFESTEDSVLLHYNENEPLYEYPQYITENKNQDVIICDSSKGALIATDVRGKFCFRYTGYLENSEFDPNGICTDSHGQILVCDLVTNSIQVIDKKGKFLFFLLTSRDGIRKSFCLNLKHDTMWVGTKANSLMVVYNVEYE